MELKPLPGLANPKYWSERVLNEQVSNFNQMAGAAVAIKLSHFYLGHFTKYGAKLEDAQGRRTPINNLLTLAEWNESVKAGIGNSVETGLGVEGVLALFEAIDKMPRRPEWTAYFMPPNANTRALKKDIMRLERKALAGEE
jgi:hypothetical protein